MSRVLIQQYLAELSKLRQVGGTHRESVVREAFKDLLKGWARSHDLTFVPEYEIETPAKERRYVDGALLYGLRLPFGYWEAKDEKDDLDAEIEFKFRRGYPTDNIVFEDSREAVLIQNKREVMRCAVDDIDKLQRLLELFFGYERPEIAEFRKAVEQFRVDLPAVCDALRAMIEQAYAQNKKFHAAADNFLDQAHKSINPALSAADVREILIQHILTEEIFALVFPGTSFHEDNNIARELYGLEHTFFTGNTKHQTLRALEPYYAAIRRSAGQISSHHEKQTFLKVVYENFYKVYNPKAADRLGVVYTPNEIVRFMIESADWLCETHFGRNLIDRDVEILDPAAGTGTFISELLEHFRGQPAKLKHKYLEELHANEVAILPYYVANLNIEATYAAISGEYLEYPNLCFVDTLDNVAGLRRYTGQQIADLFGMGEENIERIKRQNRRKISVVIGNPPYNANQANENDNNKNREYPDIDARIKDTYIKASTAQKTKLYDMYARFFRWASDRIAENGVVAFVSNSSFIDARTFDGFRKCLAREFNEAWIVDLKGNARTSGERRRREGGNIFENKIRVGVAVWFCVKKKDTRGFRIFYDAVRDYTKADEKLDFLTSKPLRERRMTEIRPDARHNWLNLTDNDFDSLIPVALKRAKNPENPKSIFRQYTNGINTARDNWVYDFCRQTLLKKVAYLVDTFNADQMKLQRRGKFDRSLLSAHIKWSEALLANVMRQPAQPAKLSNISSAMYRPFVAMEYYWDETLSDRLTSRHGEIFGQAGKKDAPCINISAPGPSSTFRVLTTCRPTDWHFLGDTQIYPRETRFKGNVVDNITDWALKQFKDHYKSAVPLSPKPSHVSGRGGKSKARAIDKQAIFHYVYAVLHDPIYREKYAQNLKREFPRIPLYADFWCWAECGRQLMELHIGYESVEPWPLKRTDVADEKARKNGAAPKAMLKSDKDNGRIVLDSETTLGNVPAQAWEYKLGNRSALEWILDQYKEKKPKDPTIREKFNTYRFADYKEKVIDLLARVTRVSLETQRIVEAMRKVSR